MVHRFATYEEAALFVAKMRSDGYGAEILNDNASTFWGPITAGGVRVWASEEPIGEEDEMPEVDEKPFSLPRELSLMVAMACLVIPGVLLLVGLLSQPAAIVAFAVMAVLVAIWLLFMGVLSMGLCAWVEALRDPSSRHHELALAVIGFIATIMLFVMLVYGTAY